VGSGGWTPDPLCASQKAGWTHLPICLCYPLGLTLGWLAYVRRQRLYREVKHAVRSLYVRRRGGGGHAWFRRDCCQLVETPAHEADLPGPHGGRRLLIAPMGHAERGERPDDLPKASRAQPGLVNA
jgi:hypothetical protein